MRSIALNFGDVLAIGFDFQPAIESANDAGRFLPIAVSRCFHDAATQLIEIIGYEIIIIILKLMSTIFNLFFK